MYSFLVCTGIDEGVVYSSMRDTQYELELVSRIESAVVDGVRLTQLKVAGDASLWHRFRMAAFADVRKFLETGGSYSEFEHSTARFKKHRAKSGILFCFAIIVTMGTAIWLLVRRPSVLVLGIDKVSDKNTQSDFRMRRIYTTLFENNVAFLECFHTSIDKRLVSNFLIRKRPALYFEAFDGLWYGYRFFVRLFSKPPRYDITNVEGTDDEIRFIKTTIKKYLGVRGLLEFRTTALKTLLRFSNITMVVGIDDVRHYQELMEACRELAIKTLVVQHGHFTKYHVGWLGGRAYESMRLQRAEKIFVWSEYWKEELLRLGSVYRADEIVVAGYPNKSTPPSFLEKIGNKIVILIPHERDAPLGEVSDYIRTIGQCKDAQVFLKLRPDIAQEEQLSAYPHDVRNAVIPVTDLHSMQRPDAVMGVYSTFLYDMALLGIPLFRMKTSTDYGEEMVLGGLADEVTLETVCDALKLEKLPSPEKIARRISRLDSEEDFQEMLLRELKASGVV